jgi:hypothetical protein
VGRVVFCCIINFTFDAGLVEINRDGIVMKGELLGSADNQEIWVFMEEDYNPLNLSKMTAKDVGIFRLGLSQKRGEVKDTSIIPGYRGMLGE